MNMHSWVFRNRCRLSWVYRPAPPEPEPAIRPVPEGVGLVERVSDEVILHPAPRQAG